MMVKTSADFELKVPWNDFFFKCKGAESNRVVVRAKPPSHSSNSVFKLCTTTTFF